MVLTYLWSKIVFFVCVKALANIIKINYHFSDWFIHLHWNVCCTILVFLTPRWPIALIVTGPCVTFSWLSSVKHPDPYTPSQWGNYTTTACSITPLPPWIYFLSENSIWRSAAVTHNLIGRKIISNVKHSDARNPLPILDVIRSSDKRHSASKYCKWTLRQTTGVCYTRIYVLGAPSHFPTEYRHEAAVVSREHRMKWVVVLGDGYQWPLPWECTWSCSVPIHQVITILATSKNVLFPGHNHLLTTGTDDPALASVQAIISTSS